MQNFVVSLKWSRSVQINHFNCFQERWCKNEFYQFNLEDQFPIYLINHCSLQDSSSTWHRKCCHMNWLSLLSILFKRSNCNLRNISRHWYSQLNSCHNWELKSICRENIKKELGLMTFWDLKVEGGKNGRYARVSKQWHVPLVFLIFMEKHRWEVKILIPFLSPWQGLPRKDKKGYLINLLNVYLFLE